MTKLPDWVESLKEDATDKWNRRLWKDADILKLITALETAVGALEEVKLTLDPHFRGSRHELSEQWCAGHRARSIVIEALDRLGEK